MVKSQDRKSLTPISMSSPGVRTTDSDGDDSAKPQPERNLLGSPRSYVASNTPNRYRTSQKPTLTYVEPVVALTADRGCYNHS